jgi:hypothetical protein
MQTGADGSHASHPPRFRSSGGAIDLLAPILLRADIPCRPKHGSFINPHGGIMRHRIGGVGVVAMVLLAACEPMVSAEPRLEPQPLSARNMLLGSDADIDAVLQALHPGKPIQPGDREAFRQLGAAMSRMTPAPRVQSSSPPVVSPAIERALRDLMEADGDTDAITRILQRLVAERNAETR